MKSQIVLFFILLCAASTWTACTDQKSKHRELLDWLDKNEGAMFLSKDKSASIPDSTYIAILEKVSKANLALQQTDSVIIGKNDALSLLKRTIDFSSNLNLYYSGDKWETDHIDRDIASPYYNNYLMARSQAASISSNPPEIKSDTTKSALFTLPHIIFSLNEAFHPNGSNWVDTSWWQDKGLIIYPANYGSKGDLQGNHKNQSTFIVQVASDAADTQTGKDSWHVYRQYLYNFGDLEPPKLHISNPADSPK